MASLAVCLGWTTASRADVLLNFPFNEGTGNTTTDTANGLIGVFGTVQDPAVDNVQLVDQSPSGQAGDRAIQTFGSGFLLADASGSDTLASLTNGPITMEAWVFIDPNTPAKTAEGILAYGGSYKMGLRSGLQVFTLYGIVDVVNNGAGPITAGQWVHLAAAWEPGVGVHFYVDGTEHFEPDTNAGARPALHNYLSLASEGLGNNSVATFDRLRIHDALLTQEQIDSVAATPKAALPSTVVNYQFDVANFPATNSVSPSLPTMQSSDVIAAITGPAWTNDTPSGQAGDFALAFLTENPPVKEVVTVDAASAPIDLAANGTNYTLQAWVKLPTGSMEERRVIYRSNGDAPRISLSINANRTLHTTVLGTADFTTGVRVPDDNRWHHIAVVMEDFARLRFYLDGALRQTVNRTQTGAASGGGSPQLLIGKESETRYFRGILDRVIINNDALPREGLDFLAAPGVPTFDALASHPTDVVTASGSTVTFTAAPTAATGTQWYYRTNLADQAGVPLAGQTGTTLTLNGVGAANEGYYYLVATNASGRTESYAARLVLGSRFALPSTGFEAPEYTSGTIHEQNEWTTDQHAGITRILTAEQIASLLEAAGLPTNNPVHSGNQALVISGAGLATTTIRQVTGLEEESNVTVEFWVRPLAAGTTTAPTGNAFITLENSSGTRAAALRFGPGNSLDYGTAISGVWQATGLLWDESTWYSVRFELDYTARTYDMFVNDVKVNTEPIPFYTATADRFSQLRFFRGANQAGYIVDDLTIETPGGGDSPELSIRRQSANEVVISWPAETTGFVLQATEQLVPANWTTVQHTTVGAENQSVVQTTGQSRFFRLGPAN